MAHIRNGQGRLPSCKHNQRCTERHWWLKERLVLSGAHMAITRHIGVSLFVNSVLATATVLLMWNACPRPIKSMAPCTRCSLLAPRARHCASNTHARATSPFSFSRKRADSADHAGRTPATYFAKRTHRAITVSAASADCIIASAMRRAFGPIGRTLCTPTVRVCTYHKCTHSPPSPLAIRKCPVGRGTTLPTGTQRASADGRKQ